MKNLLKFYILIFSFCFAFSQEKSFKVTELNLDNGLKVMLTENSESSNVFGVVAVRAGGKNDPADATGIAHYLEHVLFKGTDKLGTNNYEKEKILLDSIALLYEDLSIASDEITRNNIQSEINKLSVKAGDYAIPNEFDRLLSQMGGTDVNAFTTPDYTAYHNSFPSSQIEKWLEIYSHRFLNPVFRLFQSELETVYEEKNISMDDNINLLFEAVLKNIYKKHPYGQQSILGSVEHLKNPSLKKMYQFFNDYYVANNMVLSLAGNFDTESILPLIKEKFGRIKSGEVPKLANYVEDDFEQREFLEYKMTPIKLGGLVYRTPSSGSEEKIAFDLAMQILSNYEETGFFDKLRDNDKLMAAQAIDLSFNDYGASIVLFIPKLIGQKLQSAENIVLYEISKLKNGEFSEEFLDAIKINKLKEFSLQWENNQNRALEMVNAFMLGKNWDEYYNNYYGTLTQIDKEEVVRVSNKYFGNNYLCFNSRMGSPKKTKLTKPGYTPIIPKNNVSSNYAKEFNEIPSTKSKEKFVDFDADIKEVKIGDKITLYKTANPFNEIFDFEIKFGVGTENIPEISFLGNYLSLLGTSEMTVTKLKEEFHKYGATYYFSGGLEYCSLHVTGVEKHVEEILKLSTMLINELKFEDDKIKQVISEITSQKKLNRDNAMFMAQSLAEYALLGEKSPKLKQLTKKQMKKFKASKLEKKYSLIKDYEKSIYYTGNYNDEKLISMVNEFFVTDDILKEKTPKIVHDRIVNKSNIVYLLDDKNAVQNHIVFGIEGSARNNKDVPVIMAFNNYFGNGMSGIVFQEIREFRSLAYATFANYALSPLEGKNNLFQAYIGCQSDKTDEAIETMLGLINSLPEKSERFESIVSYISETSKTSKPNFRNVLETVETWKTSGFVMDPNKFVLDQIDKLAFQDIISFYEAEIKNKPIVMAIYGDIDKVDMKKLENFGTVKKVKKSDIFSD